MFKYYHNNKAKARKKHRKNHSKISAKLGIILIRLKTLFHQKSAWSRSIDFYIKRARIKILKSIA